MLQYIRFVLILLETSLRESSFFRKEDGHWKMISRHADDLSLWENVVD